MSVFNRMVYPEVTAIALIVLVGLAGTVYASHHPLPQHSVPVQPAVVPSPTVTVITTTPGTPVENLTCTGPGQHIDVTLPNGAIEITNGGFHWEDPKTGATMFVTGQCLLRSITEDKLPIEGSSPWTTM